jgi:hypothetical protein
MSKLRDRREFLRLGLGAAAAVAAGGVAGIASAQQFATKSLNVRPLREGLYQLEGLASNMLLFDHRAARLMVDSGSVGNGAELALIISQRLGGAPVGVLLNTHWHPDHTGGNDMLGRGGAKIVAHESTRLWMSTEYYVDWQDKTYEPRDAVALPNDTFYSSDPQPIVLDIGDEQIEYGTCAKRTPTATSTCCSASATCSRPAARSAATRAARRRRIPCRITPRAAGSAD